MSVVLGGKREEGRVQKREGSYLPARGLLGGRDPGRVRVSVTTARTLKEKKAHFVSNKK